MDEDDGFRTPEQIAGFLALKHANGASWRELFAMHEELLRNQSVCPYREDEWAHPEWNSDD